ncbi:MAG: hypothetical protein K2Y39_11245 [Candidatus Obscuribacterales bacterium]|nr:hypothetical protein [Candidatus Obscuribacterales bacterium]
MKKEARGFSGRGALVGAFSACIQLLLLGLVVQLRVGGDVSVPSVHSAAQHIGIMMMTPMIMQTLFHWGKWTEMPAQTATTATQSSTNASSRSRGFVEPGSAIAGGGSFGMVSSLC